ncbi:alpha 1,2-mannosyltransferase [Nematocida homosporus]|uniref:alpha 1,2-mannosyltransferase n=1 Tax=Nematocida homosporus TaxID=1912981 RepID=UPI00221FF76F|nr:alpha 1,2-mannosyltransferase [Nematocida homosporus]KAI5184293.1 alpha 1,2-mannosyltransferase [Nematocida homosporus]
MCLSALLMLPLSWQKENACLFILCRNTDIQDLEPTIRRFEEMFNGKFQYPYVLLNNEEFTPEFKDRFKKLTSAAVEFGLIPKEHWSYPAWIDQERAKRERERMKRKKIIYGEVESYRHMCRFFSGFFYKHPLLTKYEYYWRIEPGTTIHCPIKYDPFAFMKENKKKYGFVITLHEYPETIASLWKSLQGFVSAYNTKYQPGQIWSLFDPNNLHRFITDEMYTQYNMCHFWSNFEIADFSVFRNPSYQMLFDYLDRTGGFFYERWGDAPVHTIALALFLPSSAMHYFEDIGYTHPPFTHCPAPALNWPACDCDPKQSVDLEMFSCINLYKRLMWIKKSSAPQVAKAAPKTTPPSKPSLPHEPPKQKVSTS